MIIKSAVRLMISLYTEKGIYPSTFPLPNPLLLAIESTKAFFANLSPLKGNHRVMSNRCVLDKNLLNFRSKGQIHVVLSVKMSIFAKK